jgi:hypothetical protein
MSRFPTVLAGIVHALTLLLTAVGLSLLCPPAEAVEPNSENIHQALSPKECYDRIGNPKWDLFKQIDAYKQLRTTAKPRAEACYWLAESYISGKTGKGGPAFEVNRSGYPPNRTFAYKEAIPLLEEAAKDDHIPSLVRLYDLFHEGKYLPADHDKALTCLLQLDRLDQRTYRPVLERFHTEELSHVKSDFLSKQATTALAESGFKPAESAKNRDSMNREAHSATADEHLTSVNDATSEPPHPHTQPEPTVAAKHVVTTEAGAARTAETAPASQSLSGSDLIGFGVLFALLLAIIAAVMGTYLGIDGRVVVFYKKADLILSILIVIGSLLMIPFAINKNPALSQLIWGVLAMVVLAAWISFWANRSILKALASLSAKLTMSALLVLIAAFAWSSWTKAASAAQKGNRREAAKQAAFALGATGGTTALYRFILRLIRSERL